MEPLEKREVSLEILGRKSRKPRKSDVRGVRWGWHWKVRQCEECGACCGVWQSWEALTFGKIMRLRVSFVRLMGTRQPPPIPTIKSFCDLLWPCSHLHPRYSCLLKPMDPRKHHLGPGADLCLVTSPRQQALISCGEGGGNQKEASKIVQSVISGY